MFIMLLVSFLSSCTDDNSSYYNLDLPRVDQIENIEYNAPYSVDGLTKIKVYLSGNEEYARVTLRTGYNSFCDTDGGYYNIQADTLYIDIDPNWTVGRFQLQYGTEKTKVHIQPVY